MPKVNAKELSAALKKGELSRIYYIFGADVNGVSALTRKIVKAAVGGSEEFALTKLDGKHLDFSELEDLIGQFNMMSEYNCILINDYNCEKPFEDMRGKSADDITKKLISVLKDIPEHTVVIFNVTGFEIAVSRDYRSGKTTIKDKNKKLADLAEKKGILCEMPIKTSAELAKIIASKVSARGGAISLDNSREIAELCLCDELVIENEISKLCAYADGREITLEMIKELVHERNDTTVYNLANAVAALNAKAAFEAIDELNVDKDNRGAVLFAISSAFMDLYRAACAKKAGVPMEKMISDFSYGGRAFAAKNAFRDCSRMSVERLRNCIVILRDTIIRLNSSPTDPRTAIEQAVTLMLKKDGRTNR